MLSLPLAIHSSFIATFCTARTKTPLSIRAGHSYAATNTKHNNPYKESHHPFYSPIEKLPDTAIKEMGSKLFEKSADFWNPAEDATTGSGEKSDA